LGVLFQSIVTETDDGAAPGLDQVEVRIPRTLAPDGRLFTRLHVVVAPGGS
jgi:hypothetical protein